MTRTATTGQPGAARQDRLRLLLRSVVVAGLCLFLGLCAACPARAGGEFGGEATPEGWVWSRLVQGKVADLAEFCSPHAGPIEGYACRRISADFIEMILTDDATLHRHGIQIRNAVVTGNLDLADAHVDHPFCIERSLFLGEIDLSRARFGSLVSLESSTVMGKIDGSEVEVAGDLNLRKVEAKGGIVLNNAHIGGNLTLASASVSGDMNMMGIAVQHDLDLFAANAGGNISVPAAHVLGRVYLSTGKFGKVKLFDLRVEGDLYVDAQFKELDFNSARIGGSLHMAPATVTSGVNMGDVHVADDWQIGGSFGSGVYARDVHVSEKTSVAPGTIFFGPFTLTRAHLDSDLIIEPDVLFKDGLQAAGLQVAGTLSMRAAQLGLVMQLPLPARRPRPEAGADLSYAHIGGDLDMQEVTAVQRLVMKSLQVDQSIRLSGASLQSLDLSGAKVGEELLLGHNETDGACWPDVSFLPLLRLTNAHVGVLAQSLEGWPRSASLYGLKYDRFEQPSEDGDATDDPVVQSCHQGRSKLPGNQPTLSEKTAEWPEAWLKLDSSGSTQPYFQLASMMATEGDQQQAADLQYHARVMDRVAACKPLSWLDLESYADRRALTCGSLWALQELDGYGIGYYTWRALWWVIGLVFLGMVVVWTAREGEPRRWARKMFWCFGASLEKVVPYVQIDRSFQTFFEEAKAFTVVHKIFFALLALAGSALGLFLAAAASGLTQKG